MQDIQRKPSSSLFSEEKPGMWRVFWFHNRIPKRLSPSWFKVIMVGYTGPTHNNNIYMGERNRLAITKVPVEGGC